MIANAVHQHDDRHDDERARASRSWSAAKRLRFISIQSAHPEPEAELGGDEPAERSWHRTGPFSLTSDAGDPDESGELLRLRQSDTAIEESYSCMPISIVPATSSAAILGTMPTAVTAPSGRDHRDRVAGEHAELRASSRPSRIAGAPSASGSIEP